MLNINYSRRGGMHFLKLGRLNFSWSVSKEYHPIGASIRPAMRAQRKAQREAKIFEKGWERGEHWARAEMAKRLRTNFDWRSTQGR